MIMMTPYEMAAEACITKHCAFALLSQWRRQGRARNTGRKVPGGSPLGRPAALWEVQERLWAKFLTRNEPPPSLLHLSPAEYLREAKYRWRNHTAHIRRVHRRLRAESFARRNPFVVLE